MEPTPQETLSQSLQTYLQFIDTTAFNPKILRCLFVNAYNQFLAGVMLAEKGLIPQSYNCLRMGLESEWLGLILMKTPALGLEWAFGFGEKGAEERLKKLEKPYEIRKILGDTPRITIQDRDEIYSALSDKSHTKLATVARFWIPPGANPGEGFVDCIPAGGMQGENNIARILRGVGAVLSFALADLEDARGVRLLEEGWKWNRVNLSYISEGGSQNQNGNFEPHISSKGRPGADPIQAMALLSAIRHGEI